MYTITVDRTFNGDHQLSTPEGTVEPLHSHQWIVRVCVGCNDLNKMGLAVDFSLIKRHLDKIIRPFNGKKLEDLKCFDNINASAENLAKYVFLEFETQLTNAVKLLYVEVTEEPNCRARYSPGKFDL